MSKVGRVVRLLVAASVVIDPGVDDSLASGGDPDLGRPHLGVALVSGQREFCVGHLLTLQWVWMTW